jgi:hypothetical protein
MHPYEFVGTVVDSASAQPLAGVAIWPFLDEKSWTAKDGYYTVYPDFGRSGTDGTYVVTSWFYTYVSYSRKSGHDCTARPERITMILSREGYLSKRVTFEISELEDIGGMPTQIRIPTPINMERPSEWARERSANKSLKRTP